MLPTLQVFIYIYIYVGFCASPHETSCGMCVAPSKYVMSPEAKNTAARLDDYVWCITLHIVAMPACNAQLAIRIKDARNTVTMADVSIDILKS